MKMARLIAVVGTFAITVWLPLSGHSEESATSLDAAAAPAERPVAVDNLSVVFRRVDPACYGIHYPVFYMLETEVTNAQYKDYLAALYREFLAATGKSKDDDEILKILEREFGKQSISTGSAGNPLVNKLNPWTDNQYPRDQVDPPVARITRGEAQDFCKWLKRRNPAVGLFRLPTWNEWMVAVYGTGFWTESQFPPDRDDHPVAWITLGDAQDFCEWLTRRNPEFGLFRLPTWNEWMIATYGCDRNYPWGNEWQADRVHMSYGELYDFLVEATRPGRIDEEPARTEPVKARPRGRTPEGLYGLLGNVAEYIVEGDPTSKDYFNLGSRWMGGDYSFGLDLFPRTKTAMQPRKDYWGYSHHKAYRAAGLGFRVVLDPRADRSLLHRKRLFDQNDASWLCGPPQKADPNNAIESR